MDTTAQSSIPSVFPRPCRDGQTCGAGGQFGLCHHQWARPAPGDQDGASPSIQCGPLSELRTGDTETAAFRSSAQRACSAKALLAPGAPVRNDRSEVAFLRYCSSDSRARACARCALPSLFRASFQTGEADEVSPMLRCCYRRSGLVRLEWYAGHTADAVPQMGSM